MSSARMSTMFGRRTSAGGDPELVTTRAGRLGGNAGAGLETGYPLVELLQRLVRRRRVERLSQEPQGVGEAGGEGLTEVVGPPHQAVLVADPGVEQDPVQVFGAPVETEAVAVAALEVYGRVP